MFAITLHLPSHHSQINENMMFQVVGGDDKTTYSSVGGGGGEDSFSCDTGITKFDHGGDAKEDLCLG